MQVLKVLVLVLVIPVGLCFLTFDQVFQLLAFTVESKNPIWAFSPLGYLLQALPVVLASVAFFVGHSILTTKD